MIEGDAIRPTLLLELVRMELERKGQIQAVFRRKKLMVTFVPRYRERRV